MVGSVVAAVTVAAFAAAAIIPTLGGKETAAAAAQRQTLVIGATPVPHAEILEQLKPALAEQGVDLEVKVFQDFIQPNAQLASGELDGNYYQYLPFLDNFNKENNQDLVPVVPVHIEPFGAYSTRFASLDEVSKGASIAIPNDPVNAGRALVLLEEQGLLTLKNPGDSQSSIRDIVQNPRELDIKELEGAQLARSIDQVDVAFVFANYALDAGIDVNTAIFTDQANPKYAEYLVTRPELKGDPGIAKLGEALNSEATRQFILDKYQGDISLGF
ncbi:methionine ABC transporter substrate-binding protein [Zafaria cholistanensis]|uniref:Lipoprotein n=1 Tax=Zafaria cholistanensis TaxID=1682741 RepID=A0A5A7NUM7_9MICC|nr:methionine ABC transporter substrate-binding protein [Zafaria cholistanensis]